MIVTSFIVAFKPSLKNTSQFQTVPLIYLNVDMYTRCTQVAVKDYIVSKFVKEDELL